MFLGIIFLVEQQGKWWGFGSFSRKTLFCYSLSWQFGCGNFPVGVPAGRNLPGETGRMGSQKGREVSFAKTCFGISVGKWSPKTEHQPRFLIAYLVFCGVVLCSVNPQVVGSSPTGGARRNNLSSLGLRGYFFVIFRSNFAKNSLLVSISRQLLCKFNIKHKNTQE